MLLYRKSDSINGNVDRSYGCEMPFLKMTLLSWNHLDSIVRDIEAQALIGRNITMTIDSERREVDVV